ncbi:MAG: sugar phosphate isomerase/epimerase [Candidatus Bathyarchaeia archaeon]
MKYSMLVLSLDESKDMSIERLAETAARIGLDGVELYAPSLRSLAWDYLKRVKDALDARRLRVSMISLSTNLTHPTAEMWLWNRSHIKVMCELAERFETKILRVTLGHHQGLSHEQSLNNARRRLAEAIRIAEEKDVTLALENHPLPDIENRLEVLLELLETFPAENLRVNYDPANALRVGEDPVANLRALIGKVVHLHAKNGYINANNEFIAEPAVWRGQTDWKALVKELKAARYNGYLSLQYSGEQAEETLAKSLAYLKGLERQA